ncbi:LysM peptidoglycan-binding domain-containing protein [Microvirga sp. 0TCS3.31]
MTERIHTVERGETLSSLSKRYYGREDYADVIQRANKLNTDTVFVGEELKIPEIDIPGEPRKARAHAHTPVEPQGAVYDPLAGRPSRSTTTGPYTQPTKAGGFIKGALAAFLVVFGGLFLLIVIARSGKPDNRSYMERAMASCQKQYKLEMEINNCAIRLGAEKLYQIERDKMEAARSGAR